MTDESDHELTRPELHADHPGALPQAVRLKNGATLDVRIACATWESLKGISDTHPDVFAAAVALARGDAPPPEVMRRLRASLLTLPTGELRPEVRDVLDSGLRDSPTGEGVVLGNPFAFGTDAERQAVVECERRAMRNALRLFGFDDRPGSPGRR